MDEDIEYFEEYKKITGVMDKQMDDFERDFSISLPTDFKAFYTLKDGSGYPLNLCILHMEIVLFHLPYFPLMILEILRNFSVIAIL